MAIKSCKLLNGDEVLGDFEEADGKYLVKRIKLVALQPIDQDRAQVVLHPWLFSDPEAEETEIPLTACASIPKKPNDDMIKQYEQMVSPIQLLT